MPAILTEARTALDVFSGAARPKLARLCAAVVAQCNSDSEPQFGATARLLDAVVALDKAIVADIPALIDDVEVILSMTASPVPPQSSVAPAKTQAASGANSFHRSR